MIQTKSILIKYWSQKLYHLAVQAIGSRIFIDNNSDTSKCIFIAGTARSGTTWLADIISSQIPCRLMFEPFHSKLVPEYRDFFYLQYMEIDQSNDKLYSFARTVLSGMIRNRWIDRRNKQIFPRYRLIKEIRANLFLKWLSDQFPEVPLLYIIRHPCAVVNSRIELGWPTNLDLESFLLQQNLIEDYLENYLDLICNATYEEEKHAVIWSICNLVPLSQFRDCGINLIYYENLCTHPGIELPRLFECIHQKYTGNVIDQSMIPSSTTRLKSAVITGEDKISGWRKNLTSKQIDRILHVVEAFGLSNLYNESLLPVEISR